MTAGNPSAGDRDSPSIREAIHEMASAAARSASAAERAATVAEKSVAALETTVKMHRQNVRRLRIIREEAKIGRGTAVKTIVGAIQAGFTTSDRGWKRTVVVLALGIMLSNFFAPTATVFFEKLLGIIK